ncbi:MAG: fumarylacetoacetate hydrolase family protein [Bacteroidota bacterium]
MKRIVRYLGRVFLILAVIGFFFFLYLNRGLPDEISPAPLSCLSLDEGYFEPLDSVPSHIFGIGLSYAGHINETASSFDPTADPPVFQKAVSSITHTATRVPMPASSTLTEALDQLEAGLSKQIGESYPNLPALLDYEVELGFVLLEDVTPDRLMQEDYIPEIGFFIANDMSARSIAILGEGQDNRYDYWGLSKGFEGFTPVSDQVWIPNEFQANAIPCIPLRTILNGELRQDQNTSDLIYTPLQMLQAIHRRYPNTPMREGDWVLTGTPGGVIFSTPRWIVRLADMLGMDRFAKLENKISEDSKAEFLKAGDIVISEGQGLGQVEITIVDD